MCGYFDLNICLLSLSEQTLTDDSLAERLADIPDNAVVLLEDVDAAFVSRKQGELW